MTNAPGGGVSSEEIRLHARTNEKCIAPVATPGVRFVAVVTWAVPAQSASRLMDPQSPPSDPATFGSKQTAGLLQLFENSILYPPAADTVDAKPIATATDIARLANTRRTGMVVSPFRRRSAKRDSAGGSGRRYTETGR